MTRSTIVILLAALVARPISAHAQSLDDRIGGARGDRVQFSYATRRDVCGDGRTYIQVANSQWYGSWSDGDHRDACVAGPARVVLQRSGKDIVSLSVYVGPLVDSTGGVTDLGRVPATQAADYLLRLAEHADGRVSRDAIFPAVIADSAQVSSRLLAIARDHNAARETRRAAITWLSRPMDATGSLQPVADALLAIARDEDDNQSVRQQALRVLARLDGGIGLPALITLTRDAQRAWLSREALNALAGSGDPRARAYLRDAVRRADLPDEVLATAVRGFGGEYATGADVALLRSTYGKLPGDRSRDAALNAVANFGGADNVRWLLGLASDAGQSSQIRRRAVMLADRAGVPTADLIKLYDGSTDVQLKDAILAALVENGDRLATDKLMSVAKSDDNPQRRRKAIAMLSRSSDERVKQFLSDLADQR
ncbi:MAG TPA: HEAT repeat domain-containing protein [Gemmatimonadaceae bacterium]|nr:HEAT repeat domain-containing protein [Gemmatimonadaceae bacterium]